MYVNRSYDYKKCRLFVCGDPFVTGCVLWSFPKNTEPILLSFSKKQVSVFRIKIRNVILSNSRKKLICKLLLSNQV